ncbi:MULTISPECIES: hypothetical protein [Catenuloplanes]|uniref:Uncharacterized protein n=1 Tax=Catenuloplanes niger TaxID=587534 RepID=A0AAE3ZUD1_9ACTN|nr:hypothetical protein [Catenuloplanes niger]MDR7326253.1 hypothetical protein [Catenuloplanes niger]
MPEAVWDKELFPEPVVRRFGPVVTGRFLNYLAGYTRELKVDQPILMLVFVAATTAQLVGTALLSLVRGAAGSGATRRKFKELKKGPEFLVTPMRIRGDDGQLYEMELHGHVGQSTILRQDHIQVRVRPQKDPQLQPRVERIVNITTQQVIVPHPPTIWSHLGPGMLLQAAAGLVIIGLAVTLWVVLQ